MAEPEDRIQPEGSRPDGRPRRRPPIIEGEAVEISDYGSRAATAGVRPSRAAQLLARILSFLPSRAAQLLARMLSFLPSRKLAAGVAAGVVAAIIAAGAAWIYFTAEGGGPPPGDANLAPAPTGNVAGRAVGAAGAEAARTPPASPQRTADKTPETSELEHRLAAMDAAMVAMDERIAALDRSVRDSVAAARAAADRADKAVGELNEAKKNGDEREAAHHTDQGALDDLANRIKALESRQMTVRQIEERLDRLASTAAAPDKALRAAVAAAALRSAVERDRPFAAELAAARTLGLEDGALAALAPFATTGLPRRNDLLRDLSALLPELRRAAAPPAQDLGYLDRLQASAVRMLNIRPVKDEPGDDPAAVLSRLEHNMVQQDIEAIIAEIDKLPAPAKEVARPWRTKATARREAMEAARLIATASLARLGEPMMSGSSPQ